MLPSGAVPTNVVNSFVTATSYTDNGLANNVTYAYTVSAANANGQSVASAAVNATTSPAIPTSPTGVTTGVVSVIRSRFPGLSCRMRPVTLSHGRLQLSGSYTVVDYPEELTFFVDSGLNYNTTYYYEVAAASTGRASAATRLSGGHHHHPAARPRPSPRFRETDRSFVDWGECAGAQLTMCFRRSTRQWRAIHDHHLPPLNSKLSSRHRSRQRHRRYYYVVYALDGRDQWHGAAVSPADQARRTPTATPQMIKSDTTHNMYAATVIGAVSRPSIWSDRSVQTISFPRRTKRWD